MIRPTIIIKVYEDKASIIKEVLAGIEEEGVLYEITSTKSRKGAAILAKEAAEESQLEVGVGIYEDKAVLTIHKLNGKELLETETEYRKLGQNAARYVKGNSFIG